MTRDEAFSDAARQRQSHDDGAVPAAEVAFLADPDIDRARFRCPASAYVSQHEAGAQLTCC